MYGCEKSHDHFTLICRKISFFVARNYVKRRRGKACLDYISPLPQNTHSVSSIALVTQERKTSTTEKSLEVGQLLCGVHSQAFAE